MDTRANTRISTHTLQKNNLRAKTHAAPSGAEFLILKYTAINQSALPGAPARLSQWKAQAGGTLIAIYRASHAENGTSTGRLLFCTSSSFLTPTHTQTHTFFFSFFSLTWHAASKLCNHKGRVPATGAAVSHVVWHTGKHTRSPCRY